MTATQAMGSLAVVETSFKPIPGKQADRLSMNRNENFRMLGVS